MVAITLPLLLSAFTATAIAQNFQLARRVYPEERSNLEKRSVRALGGYALMPNFNEHCPNDMLSCSGGYYCCPMTLLCAGGSNIDDTCCPDGVDCSSPLLDAPYCADDSWSLWDKSPGGIVKTNYFCCSPGHVGTLSGTCVDEKTISSPTIEALQISPGGGVIETSTVVVSTAAGSTAQFSTTTTSAGSTSVTTKTSLATSVASKGTTSTQVVVATGGSATSSSASASATKSSGADKNKLLGFGAACAVQGMLAVFVGAAL